MVAHLEYDINQAGKQLCYPAGQKEIGQDNQVKIELWDYRMLDQFQGSITFALQVLLRLPCMLDASLPALGLRL